MITLLLLFDAVIVIRKLAEVFGFTMTVTISKDSNVKDSLNAKDRVLLIIIMITIIVAAICYDQADNLEIIVII